MEESGKKTGRVLVNAALVTEELLVKAQDQQVKSGQRLTEILVFLGVNADAIRKALATRLKIPERGIPFAQPYTTCWGRVSAWSSADRALCF